MRERCNGLCHMEIETTYRAVFDSEWDLASVRSAIEGARHVVLVAHQNADGDAVGSVLGMYHLLVETFHETSHEDGTIYKEPFHETALQITPMLPDGVPMDLDWLPGAEHILSGKTQYDACCKAIEEADLVIMLDLNTVERTGVLAEALSKASARQLLVDHHERHQDIKTSRLQDFETSRHIAVVEPRISSTCELVYWLMHEAFGDNIFNRDAATCLYTGICTDTGTFSYSNDRESVYLAAAALLRFGIDPMAINREIKNVFTEERLRFFGHAMDSLLTVYPEQEVALMTIPAKEMETYGVESADLTGLINEVMKLRAVDCGILIREEKERVRLSLRSKVRYDVNQLARELFPVGGGHVRAAGATSHQSLQETVKTVKRKLGLAIAAIGVMLCMSCNNVPVVESESAKGKDLTENLINANRYISQGEETSIDSYASRRGWQMTVLPCGARVMMTEEGKGEPVAYDETVVINYRVENLGGEVIYGNTADTVVAGRLEPTRGLDAALLTMRHGDRAWVIVPSELAYGVVGDGDRIGTRTVLVYELRIEN